MIKSCVWQSFTFREDWISDFMILVVLCFERQSFFTFFIIYGVSYSVTHLLATKKNVKKIAFGKKEHI